MADNTRLSAGTADGVYVAGATLTVSGDSALVQMVGCGILSGSESSWTFSQFVGGAGAVAAGVQRVTLASDDPAVALLGTIDADTSTLAGAVSGTEVQVDVVAALPAGTNLLGKVGIDQTTPGTTNAVVEASGSAIKTAVELIDNAVDGNYLNVNLNAAGTDLSMNAGVLTAQTMRVTIATDDEVNNLLGTIDATATNIDSNIGQVELDLANIQVSVQIMDDWDESDRCKVNPIVGQAGIAAGTGVDGATVPRVTLATDVALPAGTNAIGKLAANSGVDIGDVDVTSIAAGTNTIGGTISQQSSSILYDGTTACTVKRVSGVAAGGAPGTDALVAAVSGKKIRILALFLKATSATANNIYLGTTTDTDVLGNSGNPIPLAVDADGDNDSGFVLPWNPGGWTETSTANEALNLYSSAAQDIVYALTYIEVA